MEDFQYTGLNGMCREDVDKGYAVSFFFKKKKDLDRVVDQV